MKRLAPALVLVALVLSLGTASAEPAAHRHWLWSSDEEHVLVQDTEPTAADGHIHVKFKRYGGTGQREVRIRERQMRPATPWRYSDRVRLSVGEKVVFTTEGSVPCAPEKRPLQLKEQFRVKLPGERWGSWTWTSATYRECAGDE